jgi:nitrogen-specific signal transduction histidine kinase
VVHGIIQEHGGQIEVESELAKARHFILLPLVRFDCEGRCMMAPPVHFYTPKT